MKKIILFAGLLFCGIIQAQEITVTGNGQPISEGETITVNTLTDAEAKVSLVATNISDTTINLKLRVNSITNNNSGGNVQFCFGECYFQIDPGDTVPSDPAGMPLAPNESNNPADHFWNFDEGDTPGPISYNLSFIKVDGEGNVLGTLLTFNYVYQPTMGTDDLASLQNTGISVNNTVVKDVLTLNATQPANLQLFSVTGQLVKTVAVTEGTQALDLSGLNSAVYIAKFTNNNNQSSSIRIVKK